MSGYGYAEYVPGGGLDASQGLQGPGTTAYYQDGRYSSYASESYYGGIFEQNTTDAGGYVATSDSYTYRGSSHLYSHYSTYRAYTPPHYGASYYGGGDVVSNYQLSKTDKYYSGNYAHAEKYTSSLTVYSDGTYELHSDVFSVDYANGHVVPGSDIGTYSTTSGYIGGYGGYSYASGYGDHPSA